MGRVLHRNQPCLRCKSSDAVQVYEEGPAHCFSCGASYDYEKEYQKKEGGVVAYSDDNYRRNHYNKKEITVEDIIGLPVRGIKERLITKQVAEFYGLRASYDELGEIERFYFPFSTVPGSTTGYKCKNPSNKSDMYTMGDTKTIFGLEHFMNGGNKIIITEGEEDAMAIAQASLNKYKTIYPCVSMGSSTQTAYLLKNRETLRKFNEIIIWFDNDEPGLKGAKEAGKILGSDKVKIVHANEKDACDVLKKYGDTDGTKKIWTYIFDAKPYSPAGIVHGEETWDRYKEFQSLEFVPWPPFLSRLNELTFGRALGTITMFAAGCHGKGTEILMHDGSLKKVEDVVVGDRLLGELGQPQEVLDTVYGTEQLYRVEFLNGESMVVNESHILSLVYCKAQTKYSNLKTGDIINVTVREYLTWGPGKQHSFKQYFGPGFEGASKDLPIDPWLLGVWLGDGTAAEPIITNTDKEIWEGVKQLCDQNDWELVDKAGGKDISKRLRGGFKDLLKQENLLNNKHIPEKYLRASREQRLQLLAGLLDTDGSLTGNGANFEITQVREELALQIERLAKGLGLRAKKRNKWSKQWGKFYYRVLIFGDAHLVPVRVARRKAKVSESNRSFRRIGFSLVKLGIGEYYGVVLGGSHLYHIGTGIVTHNTGVGKSTLLREDVLHLIKTTNAKIGACFLEEDVGETVGGIIGLELNKRIGLPGVESNEGEEFDAWASTVGAPGRTIFVDHQGSVSDDSLIDKLEFLILNGCTYLYLDHITIAISETDDKDINAAIDKFMSSLLKLVKKHKVWIGVVSHLRKVKSGEDSFESGAPISEDDLKGSGSLKQISFQTIAISRNKSAASEKKRNKSRLYLLKDRKTGSTGPAGAYRFDSVTGRLLEEEDKDEDEFEIEVIK